MSLTDPSSLAAPDEDIPLSDVLTRDLLRSGKLDRMVAAAVPGLRLMSDAEREEHVAAYRANPNVSV